MNDTFEMPKPEEEMANVTMKISYAAKKILYGEKNLNERYSETIIRLVKQSEFLLAKWNEHLLEKHISRGECHCEFCMLMIELNEIR